MHLFVPMELSDNGWMLSTFFYQSHDALTLNSNPIQDVHNITLSGKRKPWRGILLYGVRFYQNLIVRFVELSNCHGFFHEPRCKSVFIRY